MPEKQASRYASHAVVVFSFISLFDVPGGVMLVCAQPDVVQSKTRVSADRTKLFYGEKLLLEAGKDGFMSIHQVHYSPRHEHFLVIGCGYECNDNIGFLFDSDGTGKQKFTARWDFILQDKAEWSVDGQKLFYYRTNSSGEDPPVTAPVPGWIQLEIKTGRKAPAVARQLKTSASYGVFRVRGDDLLNVRAAPGTKSPAVGSLPHNAKGVKVTGPGKQIGRDVWVPIKFQNVTGWVNQSYLFEEISQAEVQSEF